jgi:hypothetical protein
VVVVDPDNVTPLVVLHDAVGKCLVDLDVEAPRVVEEGLALGVVRDDVVEDGPQDGLAVVRVVAIEVLVTDVASRKSLSSFRRSPSRWEILRGLQRERSQCGYRRRQHERHC